MSSLQPLLGSRPSSEKHRHPLLRSASALNLDQLTLKNLMLILIPGVLAIIGIYLYFTALSGSSASKIVPLTAIYPLFTCFYAYVFLKEDFTTEKIIGTILIVTGVFVLNYKDYLQNLY